MQAAMGEVDGVPAQRHQLGRPQPVPVGDQHHGGIAVAVAVLPGNSDQAGDLGVGQIFARADLGVALTARARPMGDCPIIGGWRHQRQMRICHDFSGLSPCYCPVNKRLRDTAQGEKRRFYGHNCHLDRGGRTGHYGRDAEWRAFSVGGQPTPPQRWPAEGGNAQWRTAIHRRDFFGRCALTNWLR